MFHLAWKAKLTYRTLVGDVFGDGQLTGHIVNDDGHGGVSDVARDQAAEPLLPSCVPAHFHIRKKSPCQAVAFGTTLYLK